MDSLSHSNRALPPLQYLSTDKSSSQESDRKLVPGMGPPFVTTPSNQYPTGPPPPYSSHYHSQPPSAQYPQHGLDGSIAQIQDRQRPSVTLPPASKILLPSLSEALGVKSTSAYADSAMTPVAQTHRDLLHSPRTSSNGASSPPLRRTASHATDFSGLEHARSNETRTYSQQFHHGPSQIRRSPPALSPLHQSRTAAPFGTESKSITQSPRDDSNRFAYGYSAAGAATTSVPTISGPIQRPVTESLHSWMSALTPAAPAQAARRSSEAYSESIKRHLDMYDFETALNEITDNSAATVDFARQCGSRLHHVQRAGITSANLPEVIQVEDLMNKTRHTLDALARMRDMLATHHAASLQQQNEEKANLANDSKRVDSLIEDTKPDGFAGSEPKKRRGRNAAPGRCHSCNRAETPEWRRGPDGARTLCNACGLHYAKLTRKAGANKASSESSSASFQQKPAHGGPGL